ncbi:MAG: hypothetical protein ACLFTK_07770, partial [Anaerolineales bacterium]
MTRIQQIDQLPFPPPEHLIGRAEMVNHINALLTPEHAVLVYGAPGMGKHALAATLAAQRVHAAQDVLWLNAALDDVQLLAGGILRAYGLQPAAEPDNAVRDILQQHAPLVILDDVPQHSSAAQFIRRFSQGLAPVLILHETAADGPWETQRLRALNDTDRYALFAAILGASGTWLAPDNPVVQSVLQATLGHPFTVTLAARQIAGGVLTLDGLHAALPPPEDPTEQAQMVIQAAFARLDAPSQGLLLALAANFTPRLSLALLMYLIGPHAHQLTRLLRERGLLLQMSQGDKTYFYVHPLVKAFGMAQLAANGRLDTARLAMLNAILKFCKAQPATPDILLPEMPNILLAALFSADDGHHVALEAIVSALSGNDSFIAGQGYQPELEHIQRLAQHARTMELPAPDWAARTSLSKVDTQTAQPVFTEAPPAEHARYRPPEDHITEGEIVDDEAPAQRALTTPLQNLLMSLDVARARQDRPAMAQVAMHVGAWYLDNNQPDDALGHFRDVLQLYQDMGDLHQVLATLEHLATISHQYAGADAALDYTRRGLNMARQLGDDEAFYRFALLAGDIRLTLGDAVG